MDPTPEAVAEWQALKAINDQRLSALAQQGFRFDIEALIRQSWLEHILEAVAGADGVMQCRLDTQRMIADVCEAAEQQVNRAKLLAPGSIP